jgi:hypothetical protein
VSAVVQSRPTSEAQAQDLSDALVFAEKHPDDVGYPWIEPKTGSLELSAATSAGIDLLEGQRSDLATATSIRQVKFSYGTLESIKHEVTTLHAMGVPDADLVYATSQDHQSDRVVIRVRAPSARLFEALAARYGTDAIAVLIDPESFGGSPMTRQADISPYWGGAKILGVTRGLICSDSFPWTTNSSTGNAMLTAAHCAPVGGNIQIDQVVGSVNANSEENWSETYGTTYYTGQTTYRGDVALIRLKSTLRSGTQIYRGGPSSGTSSSVSGRRTRYSALNDWVLVGGERTGETGPYRVVDVLTDWWYSECGPNCWVRNITRAGNPSGPPCSDHGDSGGSVFVSPVSGGVTAAGTYSGIWGISNCNIVFTDIYSSYLAFPGDIYH